MKKFINLVISILFLANFANAEPIVELSAPRIQPKFVSETPNSEVKSVESPKTSTKSAVKNKTKKKKIKKKIAKPPVLDYKKATKYIENGYYSQADALIQNVISKNKKDINAPILSVVSQAKQGDIYSAENKYNTLIKKYPKNSDLIYAKGIIDYKKAQTNSDPSQSQKLTQSALNNFKKAIILDKLNAKAYNAAGVVSLNSGDTETARTYFNKAYAIDKSYSNAIDNLGTIDYTTGKFDSAEKKFKQALAINPQNSTALYHLAQVSIKKQDYASATNYINKAISLNSNIPAYHNLKGKIFASKGNDAQSIDSLKKSLNINPQYALSYLDLAHLYTKRGDNEFAIEQLKTAISLNPGLYSAKLELANLSLLCGKYQQAITLYSELSQISEYKTAALSGLANAYYGQAIASANKSLLATNKDFIFALNSINKAIEANGDNLELHLAKLKLAKITNQGDLTKVELKKIIQSPSNDLISNLLKGEAYLTLNDYKNAQNSFNLAAKQASNDEERLYLAEILIYQKQFDNAQNVLKCVLKNDPTNLQAQNGIDFINKNKKAATEYYQSAQKFIKNKNYPIAKEYLNRSVQTNPNDAQVRLELAKLCEKLKDSQGAYVNYSSYAGLSPDAKDIKSVKRKIEKFGNRI